MTRPKLDKNISPEDFNDFYWLKSELIKFCREIGISSAGGKQEIAGRIHTFLSTGKKEQYISKKKTSKFDWDKEFLSRGTIITDNFRNTYNVREFMKREIGSHYRVNVPFLSWTKENIGKNLGDAIEAWKNIIEKKRLHIGEKEIGSQFEYNTYIRDFLKDNPESSRQEAIKYWKIKREKRGSKKYSKTDLL